MSDAGDPVRFSDPRAQAPEALRNLFAHGERDLPTPAQLDRLAARLGPALAPPTTGGGLPAATPRLLWGLGVAALVAAGATAWLVAGRAAPPSESTPPPDKATVLAPTVAPSVAEPPTVASNAGETSDPSASSSEAAAPSAPSNTAAQPRRAQPSEAALLEQARRALASDPARALALTRQHQQRFPNGILNQEREVIAIEALRKLGKGSEASDRAGSFEKQYPDSAHRRAVESGAGK